mmetsp:Transcript_15011/g.30519  ORF Transcript_15011/g.30519 Transcript_15011/m.30519 type:complete len:450 (-) Transcript_15011:606-1955(-)
MGDKFTERHNFVEKDVAIRVLNRVNVLSEADYLAVDIGGSLAKLMYVQPNTGSPEEPRRLLIDRILEADSKLRCSNIISAGGTSAGDNREHNRNLSFYSPDLGGTAHFFSFETRNIEELVRFIVSHWGRPALGDKLRSLRATGGGAFKYAHLLASDTGFRLNCLDEMQCAVEGLNFLLAHVDNEVFSVREGFPVENGAERRQFQPPNNDPFPYLLVNIGSGVSMVMVTGHREFTRVSGSSIGGGTFWGLARLLTNCKTFDEVIDLTFKGDSTSVDMHVGDIYGGDYTRLGLDANVVAASFGKVTMRKDSPPISFRDAWKNLVRALKGTALLWMNVLLATPVVGDLLRRFGIDKRTREGLANRHLSSQFNAKDVATSLLRMISYNIGQIAYLNARCYNLPRIYFAGNFIRDHPSTIAAIAFAVRFWSGGKTEALFLKHDGYLGTLGAYIL